MELSVQMLAEGEDSVLREIESAEFFINGKPIVGSYREAPRINSAGLYTAITYTWILFWITTSMLNRMDHW